MTRSLIQLMNGKIEAKDREDGKSGVAISVHFPKQAAVSVAPPMKRVEDTIITEINVEEGEPETVLPDEPIKKHQAAKRLC